MPIEEVTKCADNAPKKRHVPPPADSKRARELANIRWSKQKFADRRKEYKQAVMTAFSPAELAQEMKSATKKGDDRKLNCCIEVAKFMGCHFDQSEERVQNLSVKSDSKVSGKLEVSVTGLDG